EQRPQPGEPEGQLHLAVRAARRDTGRDTVGVERLDQLADTVDGAQLATEGGRDLVAGATVELRGQLDTQVLLDLGEHRLAGSADELAYHLVSGDRPAHLREHPRLDHDGEPFAVDEHPVAIEDHQSPVAHRASFAPCGPSIAARNPARLA